MVFCHVRGRRPSDAKAAAIARYAWMLLCHGVRVAVVMILGSFWLYSDLRPAVG